ncbi:MAG: ParB/RepB/Spo0J family partition protein [Deltaproteobacteria bacterium]|nr:ParB/RepB/Spo0J family partition protein [Deltaproteobacteria bacterium]
MSTSNAPISVRDEEPTRRRVHNQPEPPAPATEVLPPARSTKLVPFGRAHLARNVRKNVDQARIDELEASIAQVGLIQPPTGRVLPNGDHEVVIGQCRYLALQALHAKDPGRFPLLELFITTATDDELPLLQLAENLGRVSMAPYDVVVELAKLSTERNMAAPELAEKTGSSVTTVKTFLRIGRAPEYVRVLLLRVEHSVKRMDAEGAVITDRHGRPELKTEVLPGLDVKKVSALTRLAETLVSNDKRCARTPGYKPIAEKTVLRVARRCAVEKWTADTLEARCERELKAPVEEATGDAQDAPTEPEPTADANALVIKKSKLTIDLSRANALRGAARDEFVANLRAALKPLNVFIQDLRGQERP